MSTLRFSAIHGGLIARKGQASPAVPSAMRHVTYTDALPPEMTSATGDQRRDIELRSDLPLIASKKLATLNARSLAREVEAAFPQPQKKAPAPEPKPESKAPCACARKPAAGQKAKYQVTLRITAEQRKRMRTSAAQLEKPNQQILSDALDSYLDALGVNEMKGCACLERQTGLN